jgi:hypothetical protein
LLLELPEFSLPLFLPLEDDFGLGSDGLLPLLFLLVAIPPMNFRLSKQGHGIRIKVHVTTNGNQDIDTIFLIAERDRLAIKKPTVQDEPLYLAGQMKKGRPKPTESLSL